MKPRSLALFLCCLLAGWSLACATSDAPVGDDVVERPVELPPVAGVSIPERVELGELEMSGTPVAPVELEMSEGLGRPGSGQAAPTVAAMVETGSALGDGGDAAAEPGLVNRASRVTCTIAYRRWLVDAEWRDARDLHNRLPEFRQERPDCDGDKFGPVFSNLAVCQHEKRVGGVVVGNSFAGEPTATSLGLSNTKKGLTGMLVHFERLPTLDQRGCWYYLASEDYWVQGVVDESGRNVNVSEPTPAVDPSSRFLGCDSELRERLATMVGAADAGDVQALVDRIVVGYGSCNLGWGAVVSPERLWPGCPDVASGRNADGSAVVHWSAAPADGAGCWIYDVVGGSWESVPVEP